MVPAPRLQAQQGELKSMKNAIIRYILNVSSKKTPIKSIDIVKQCLRGEQKMFLHLLPEVQDILSDVSLILCYFLHFYYIRKTTDLIFWLRFMDCNLTK